MLSYCVLIEVDAEIEADWRSWMSQVHIPEVLATGYFVGARFWRVVEPMSEMPSYEVHYQAPDAESLRAYRAEAAPALIADHVRRYGVRARAGRKVLEQV